jgi:D-alanine--poly(phosphoribitol) ligase subunit 1
MNLSLSLDNIFLKFKNKNAIVIGKKKYKYDYLKKQSNQIIEQFKNEKINTKDIILIFNNKNIEEFVMMIACIRYGVIYANIDPKLPSDRIRLIIKNLKPKIFFSKKFNKDILKILDKKKIFKNKKFNKSIVLNKNNLSQNNPIYIIYTSGSSGAPKGVCVDNKNLISFIKWCKNKFNISSHDKITNLNPMYFDNSVFDFYNSIFNGATMVVFNENELKNTQLIMKILKKNRCTIWYSVPSLLIYCQNLRSFEMKKLFEVKKIIFAGEPYPKIKLHELFKKFSKKIQFFNAYGPTETTCLCSAHRVREIDFKTDTNLVTLGKLNDKNSIFKINILKKDSSSKINKGELHIGGDFVSQGYYNNSKLTLEKFYTKIIRKKRVRFYKSGDIVAKDAKGNFYFKGRSDNQIKIMGYRIEIEDIEMNINKLKYVKQSCVLFNKQRETGVLVAFVSVKNITLNKLIKDLKKLIPFYMMPKKIFMMENLPFNRNGKIDKNKLKKLL